MSYSLSIKKDAPKTSCTQDVLAPTAGEAVEIRIDDTLFAGSSKLDFWTTLERLLERIRETSEPRFPS
jgi:hypothetical protein